MSRASARQDVDLQQACHSVSVLPCSVLQAHSPVGASPQKPAPAQPSQSSRNKVVPVMVSMYRGTRESRVAAEAPHTLSL